MEQSQRVDKWLWCARFFKSRTLAAKHISEGKIRINSVKITKPSYSLNIHDVLTFVKAGHVRVIKVLGFAPRRGPAHEAQKLYEDKSPLVQKCAELTRNPKFDGKGRPTKKERRVGDVFRANRLE